MSIYVSVPIKGRPFFLLTTLSVSSNSLKHGQYNAAHDLLLGIDFSEQGQATWVF